VELGLAIARYSAFGAVDLVRFFRQVLFNYLICNDDAHLGNFELLTDEWGQRSLSPAYDLLYTHLHTGPKDYFGLTEGLYPEWEQGPTMNTEGSPGTPEFVEFAHRLGLSNRVVQAELKQLLAPKLLNSALGLIEQSYLSEESKASYKRTFEGRWRLLQRTWGH
jgi:serine/threonine-protein kinase HipA